MLRSIVTLGLLMVGASTSASLAADGKARAELFATNSLAGSSELAAALKAESGTFADVTAPTATKVILSGADQAVFMGDQQPIKVGSLALSATGDAGANKLDVLTVRGDARALDSGAAIGAADVTSQISAGDLPK